MCKKLRCWGSNPGLGGNSSDPVKTPHPKPLDDTGRSLLLCLWGLDLRDSDYFVLSLCSVLTEGKKEGAR